MENLEFVLPEEISNKIKAVFITLSSKKAHSLIEIGTALNQISNDNPDGKLKKTSYPFSKNLFTNS